MFIHKGKGYEEVTLCSAPPPPQKKKYNNNNMNIHINKIIN